jgi:hypothetical protein
MIEMMLIKYTNRQFAILIYPCVWIYVYVIKIILRLAKTSHKIQIISGIAVDDLLSICTLIAIVFTVVGVIIAALSNPIVFTSGIGLAWTFSAILSPCLKLWDLLSNRNRVV